MAEPARAKDSTVSPDDLPLEQRVRRRIRDLYLKGDESGIKDWHQVEDEIRQIEKQKHKG